MTLTATDVRRRASRPTNRSGQRLRKSQVASGADADEAPELNKALHAEPGRVAVAAENFGGVGEKLSNSCLVSRSMPDGTARNSICKIPVSVNERPVDVQARRNADE